MAFNSCFCLFGRFTLSEFVNRQTTTTGVYCLNEMLLGRRRHEPLVASAFCDQEALSSDSKHTGVVVCISPIMIHG